jgi:hypothetical protein
MKPQARHQYRERARAQALSWAMGRSYHNRVDGECCPDFSCCHPDLFEQNAEKRWAQYNSQYGTAGVSDLTKDHNTK